MKAFIVFTRIPVENKTKTRLLPYYTGKQWGHADSYDLCVNSSLLGIDGTVRFIASFIRERFAASLTHMEQKKVQEK